MRVMKSKTLFESFQENLNEIDSNLKVLKESNVLWTSDSAENYEDWSDEDFIDNYKADTGEDAESIEQARDYYLDSYDDFDIRLEDLESMVPSIQKQTTDNVILMSGTVGLWTGNHNGGKVIELNNAKDLLIGDVDIIRLVDEDGNVVWEGSHHDGTHYMGLYGLPKDEKDRIKLVKELGIVDWYKDSYDYDDPDKEALESALEDLYSASRLNDILSPDDYEKIPKLCPAIKASALTECDKQLKESDDDDFDLEDALVDVTEVAESIYKGSEINADVIEDLLDRDERLCDKYTDEQKEEILNWWINDERASIPYADLRDDIIISDVIDNYKEITGKDVKDIFNYEDNGNDADGYFKQEEIEKTAPAIIEYWESKGLDRSRIDDLLYKLDEELATLWSSYRIDEEDTTIEVTTVQGDDRDYSITDITELSQITDGDVRAPIDVAGLLVEVDNKLSESVGENWGQINFQSTRHNVDTNDSNALFELCVGDKTYLMSMLLEENATVLKVNNTKGQTIFKRKSKDMVGLAESYIKQFIPKEADEVPEVIKHINDDLHDVYNFLIGQIEISKDVPKEEKEAFNNYLQTQIYAFVAEVSEEIKANEPTDEDKLELPSFDKMVADIFGANWVKKEPEKKELELEGTEKLEESEDWEKEEPVECEILYDNEGKPYFMYNDEKEYIDEYMKDETGGAIKTLTAFSALRIVPSEDGTTVTVEYLHESNLKEEDDIENRAIDEFKEFIANKYNIEDDKALEKALKNVSEDDVNEFFSDRFYDVYDEEDLDKLNIAEEKVRKEFGLEECDKKLKESYCIVSYYKGLNEAGDKTFNGKTPKEVERKVKRFAEKDDIEIESIEQASTDLADSEYLNSLGKGVKRVDTFNSTFIECDKKLKEDEAIDNDPDFTREEINAAVDKWTEEELADKEWEEVEKMEYSPYAKGIINGLGTGYATFVRKPYNFSQLEDKSKAFTDGDASYLICKKENLSKEEFEKLQDDFSKANEYCKSFEPLDTENYAYNVIEFSCNDYDYKLLVDPSGSDYCRYVAIIGGNE